MTPLLSAVLAQLAQVSQSAGLAQVPAATRSDIVTVLLGGAALAVIANQVQQLWRSNTSAFRRESGTVEYQSRENCDKMHAGLGSQLSNMDRAATNRVDALRLEIKQDMGGVHRRVDEILAAVSDLAGQIRHLGAPR